ncbi:signal recognition particle-docking protein FtsY [Mesomycoplasma flocculare]|uniref:Signal recognition particle receptor FtsY n=2 Tax=Mesomycoplasma flocculare TaxID=2128 RepID=A0A0A8E5X0_MESFC|nr:signal recognition particle-docking protein FtsY [Mesomycoplasma flocculare]MXR39220.1 signal recognition particle-docking protein FtsY [Mycoplasma sp. MF12]AJC49590.1 signal recognition particle-docking protein FtsY [Mesomycoplasma flocculare ATCC 27399]ENX51252.1 cell division protein ftsY [Mesomycoplasma flocculare ATCC 27716]MXR05633.1 signal recognition particle-docking protein FtsY [Mesomycoplasma flocculare]MXR12003.1 signal recognition particle-docking protein FtsY [Mesomycoplasma f
MFFFWKIKEKIFGPKGEKPANLDKYVAGLTKSRLSFLKQIVQLQKKHIKINENFFSELEEILIMSDISPNFVGIIIESLKDEVRHHNIVNPKLISEIIIDKMYTIYSNRSVVNTNLNVKDGRINVFLISGVNGSGKTTSIAKIARKFTLAGKKVLIIAADTFRAAAVEQLEIWANRVGALILKPQANEKDPGSVVFRGLNLALEEKIDLVLIDTAGRLQNNVNLMQELSKINKIISKKISGAPHESLLVIDATTGQNGVSQAANFAKITPVSGIILTKMDGTSKGGIVFSIKDQIDISVKLVGLGEGMDDLQPFDLDLFIYAITKDLKNQYYV